MTQHQFARFLLFITLGHMIIGLLLFHSVYLDIWQQGWVNVVGPSYLLGSAAVWFMLFAWPLLLIVVQFWNQPTAIKPEFNIVSIICSVIGVSLMPISGFWLMLALCAYSFFKGGRFKYQRD